jgi:hypothetical protein
VIEGGEKTPFRCERVDFVVIEREVGYVAEDQSLKAAAGFDGGEGERVNGPVRPEEAKRGAVDDGDAAALGCVDELYQMHR